jgi:imidazolonepropionase
VTATLIDNIGLLVESERERPDAALVYDDGLISWIGDSSSAPATDARIDADGRCVIPGFVDTHSHLMFAGDRTDEFVSRMAGRRYEAGGIRGTVAATRAASDEELLSNATRLVAEMRRQGTTTVEIKSGYGLTTLDEARSLALARRLTPETTYLGAHVVPLEYADDVAGYVELVTGAMLDAAAPHAKWIDVFCETGAFDVDQARTILTAGIARGLGARMHAGQLGPSGGVRLAVELGAASVDHCTFLSESDIDDLAAGSTVATLLPGVLDSPALPRRAEAARRRGDCGARMRLQSGIELHLVDALLHCGRCSRHGHDTGGGPSRGDGWRSGRPPARRHRNHRCGKPRAPGDSRCPQLRSPCIPAGCPAHLTRDLLIIRRTRSHGISSPAACISCRGIRRCLHCRPRGRARIA